MTRPFDFDEVTKDWLAEGPTTVPGRALKAALDEVHVTHQRRFGAAVRSIPMNTSLRWIALAAVLALVLAGVGVVYLRPFDTGAGPQATPTPSASPEPAILPASWAANPQLAAGEYQFPMSGTIMGQHRIIITVGDGWRVVTNVGYAKAIAKDFPGQGTVEVSFETPYEAYATPCQAGTSPAPALHTPTVAEFINELHQMQGGFSFGQVNPMTFVGRDAGEFDMNWTRPSSGAGLCADSGALIKPWDSAVIDGRTPQHLILFDGGGNPVLVDHTTVPAGSPAQQELNALLASVQFEPIVAPTDPNAPLK